MERTQERCLWECSKTDRVVEVVNETLWLVSVLDCLIDQLIDTDGIEDD